MFKEKKIIAKIPLHTLGCKGIAILTIIIILFSFISIPSYAESNSVDFFDVFTPTVQIYDWNGTSSSSPMSNYFIVNYTDNTMELRVTNNVVYPSGSWIIVSCEFKIKSPYNKSGFSSGHFNVTNYASRYTFSLQESHLNSCWRTTFSNNRNYGSVSTSGNLLNFNFRENNEQVAYDTLSIDFVITTQIDLISGMVLPIYFSDLDYYYTNPTQEITDSINNGTQSIINNQNQIVENEKEETNNSGNSAIDDLTSAIPDYSGNIIQSFTKLANQVMHEQATCQITVPEIKVPKVANYFPDIVLLEEQKIKFEDYLKYIPEILLLLVRAVFSSAIVIFCCREIYGIFEYIMTMRGGSNG